MLSVQPTLNLKKILYKMKYKVEIQLTQFNMAHLRSLSLLLCFSLRWVSDNEDRALLQPPLLDFLDGFGAVLAALGGSGHKLLQCPL